MSKISQAQYLEMTARLDRNSGRVVLSQFTPCEKEVGAGGLHEQIEVECRQRMWPIVHSRTDMRATTIPGTPDFIIAAGGGRVLWVEAKAKGGKQTTEQRGFEIMLTRNGHAYHLVYSFQEFLAIADNHVGKEEKKHDEKHMETKIK